MAGMSKVLIIGNGFDIYHGLPTRYNDFLFLAENWKNFYQKYEEFSIDGDIDEIISVRLNNGKLCKESLEDFIAHKYILDKKSIEYLNEHITTNTWIRYFLNIKFKGKGWVDFEAEIDTVLHDIDMFFEILPSYANKRRLIKNSPEIGSDTKEKVRFFLKAPGAWHRQKSINNLKFL